MKLRYYKNNNSPVPKPLRHLSDPELGRETYTVDHPDDGNPHATTRKDERAERRADWENMRARSRGEDDAVSAGL